MLTPDWGVRWRSQSWRALAIAITLTALCFPLFARGAKSPATSELHGVVSFDGDPVANATIAVYPETVGSEASGAALACLAGVGECSEAARLLVTLDAPRAVASAKSRRDGSFRVAVPAGGSWSIWAVSSHGDLAVRTDVGAVGSNIELRLAGSARLVGRVVDDSGEGVPNIELYIFRDRSLRRFPIRAGSDGRFDSGPLPRGPYVVATSHESLRIRNGLEIAVADRSSHPLTLQVALPLSRFGRVVRGGSAIGGAVVRRYVGQREAEAVSSDENGRFAFAPAPDGEGLTLDASDGIWSRSRRREIAHIGAIELELEPAGSIAGSVRRPDGKPVAEAVIRVRAEGETAYRTVRADATGAFRVDGIVAGVASVEAEELGFGLAEAQLLNVRKGETTAVAVQVERRSSLSGQIVDADGVPVVGATVNGGERATVTDVNGRFVAYRDSGESFVLEVGRYGEPRTYFVAPANGVGIQFRCGAGSISSKIDTAGLADGRLGVSVDWLGSERPRRVMTRGITHGSTFEVAGLVAGAYRITAVFENRGGAVRSSMVDVVVNERNRTRAEIRFNPGMKIAGRVVGDRGEVVAGAHVRAVWSATEAAIAAFKCGTVERTSEARTLSDAEGRFELSDLLDGEFVVHVRTSDGRTASLPVRSGRIDVVVRVSNEKDGDEAAVTEPRRSP